MIVMWHISQLDMLFQLMERLLNEDRWFDVRCIVSAEKWSITFNDEWKVPPKLARFLEKPPNDHRPAKSEPIAPQRLDQYKRERKKMNKRSKR